MLLKLFNNKKGFSLLEIVITIIILGISLSAILESFIVGSASSVRIANEVTATNLAKQYMADIYYCSEAGGPSSGGTICNNFNSANGSSANGSRHSIWNIGLSGFNQFIISPQGPMPLNNYCFYTTITPTYYSAINSANGNASIYINGQLNWTPNNNSSAAAIAIVVNTGWYNSILTNGTPTCSAPPTAYPSVSLSTIFTKY
ncbi:MAG: prepilin-type N-terminal cleavage/methylation domain-containing protein [Candidatus Acididesulfobacter diazotrophicus]|jgi:prepilin-type N-terminal cleavage/methylation domain-containing protein|uniref:Prepilin-type N-terminal cleavage/methylation domain-containing protein n=1 Tax=Candidatus Acididesulfobacter diazotrophicus TaxID=2597226 RepID=A0A519BPS3_9DELT|nr:MAG: prepilin-type N-terminal cleavage/methylation domain-containing protein [Candidatus Acididesulfobacter diazotrophicus]